MIRNEWVMRKKANKIVGEWIKCYEYENLVNIKFEQSKVLNLIMREVLELQEPYKFRVKFGIKSGSKILR